MATDNRVEGLDDLKKHYPETVFVETLDVANDSNIDRVFALIKDKFGRLDIVVNNAGIGIMAEIEATPVEKARNLFDINFWGAAQVTIHAVKTFRAYKKPGRILVVSSVFGSAASPLFGYYSSAKYGESTALCVSTPQCD